MNLPRGRSTSPVNLPGGRPVSQSVSMSPRSAAALRRASPGRSQTMQYPPSFEQRVEQVIQGVEDGARSAYHSVQSGFAPSPSSRPASVGPAQSAVKPVYRPQSSADPQIIPSSSVAVASPAAKTSKFSLFFIEPGSTAMYAMVASGLMMAFACWMPFYLGVGMLWDKHYRMWIGWEHAFLVVMFSFFMPAAFVGCIYLIVAKGHGSGVRTEETMVLVGGTFTSLLGIVLCLLALPMSADSAGTIMQLSFGCDLADSTSAKLVFYSQVLHNIRNSPECQGKGSVKDCQGWKSNKYTEYLHRLENDFDCTGLCTLPAPPTAPPISAAPKVAPHPASGQVPVGNNQGSTTGPQGLFLNQKSWALSKTNRTKDAQSTHKTEMQTQLSTSSEDADAKQKIPALKLFSKDKTDQRCYPMVADSLQVTSTTAGELLFWQGVGLLFVSVLAGSVKVIDKTLFEK